MSTRLSRFMPIIVLLVMTGIIYNEPILSGNMIYGQDTMQQGYPLAKYKEMCLREGILPLWNPYMMSGLPQFASAPYHPTDPLVLFMDAKDAVTFRYVSHTFLAGLFMFLFLRHLGLSRFSGLFGAVAFGFSGFFISKVYGGHGGAFNSGIWIPLVFLFLDRLLQRGRLRDAIGLGAVLGFQVLGEHAQYAYYTGLAVVGFAIWRLAPMVFRRPDAKQLARLAVLGCVAAAMAFALSAAYLLPMLEITQMSTRSGDTGYDQATAYSMPPLYSLSMVAGNLWGSPARHNSVFGSGYWDAALYIGIIPLLLALLAVVAYRGPYASFFKIMLLLSFVLALGRYTPIYNLVYHIPGFSMMRAPSKILYLYTFAAAVLSAFGLELLRTRFSAFQKWFPKILAIGSLASLGIVASFILFRPAFSVHISRAIEARHHDPATALGKLDAFYMTQLESLAIMAACLVGLTVMVILLTRGVLNARTASVGIVGLALLELGLYGQELVTAIDPAEHFSHNIREVEYLQADPDTFRILPMEESTFAFAQGVLTGLENVNGYYPVNVRNYTQFEEAINRTPSTGNVSTEIHNYHSPLIDLLNVKYILTHDTIDQPHLSLVQSGDINIYWNRRVLPRAMIVRGSRTVATPEAALLEIQKTDFNPLESVVLIGDAPERPAAAAGEGEFARLVRHEPLEIIVEANLNSPGFLVLSERDYPSWRAYLGDQPVDILTANHLFRAVELPTGLHTVTFAFESLGRQLGDKLSYCALTVLVMLLLYLAVEALIPRKQRDTASSKESKTAAGSAAS